MKSKSQVKVLQYEKNLKQKRQLHISGGKSNVQKRTHIIEELSLKNPVN